MSRSIFHFGLLFALLCVSCLGSPLSTPSLNQTDHHAQPNLDLDLASDRAVDLSIDLDLLGIGQALADAISFNDNRDAFVRNLSYTAFYAAGSQYNVMVFNLNVDHEFQIPDVKLYASANYGDIVYGIWIFDAGWFKNNGDGGYIN